MSNSRSRPNNGGKREGAGRPKGVVGTSKALTRFELSHIPESKRPVYIMLKNMWWWDEQGDLFAAQISSGIEDLKSITDDDQKIEALNKIQKKFDAFVHARDKAQSCAVDAAPYCHAKLQSITLKPNTAEVIEVETQVVNTGARGEAVAYRENYDVANVTPIRRTG